MKQDQNNEIGFRFSLKALLLAMTIVAVLSAIPGLLGIALFTIPSLIAMWSAEKFGLLPVLFVVALVGLIIGLLIPGV